MAYLILILVALLVLGAVVMYVLRAQMKRHERVDEKLHEERTPTLEYAVPTGQDPVVILAALEREGYTATVDPNGAHQVVLVACPAGPDRERARVRAAIEAASVSAVEDGLPVRAPVLFRDEA